MLDSQQYAIHTTQYFFYLKTSKLYYIFTSRIIYDPNALALDHVNNFWDTSTPICQTESLTGIYTGPVYIIQVESEHFIMNKITLTQFESNTDIYSPAPQTNDSKNSSLVYVLSPGGNKANPGQAIRGTTFSLSLSLYLFFSLALLPLSPSLRHGLSLYLSLSFLT